MDTNTFELIELNIDLDIEPQCEYQSHGTMFPVGKAAHDDGPAKWITKSQCPDCGLVRTRLACDTRKNWFFNGRIYCTSCNYESYGIEFFVSAHPL